MTFSSCENRVNLTMKGTVATNTQKQLVDLNNIGNTFSLQKKDVASGGLIIKCNSLPDFELILVNTGYKI